LGAARRPILPEGETKKKKRKKEKKEKKKKRKKRKKEKKKKKKKRKKPYVGEKMKKEDDDSEKEDDLKLHEMELEYARLTSSYASAMASYISVLETGKESDLTLIPGHTWWGESGLTSAANVDSATECSTWCAADPKCSGATYIGSRRYCWMRQGDGAVAKSPSPGDIAIVRESHASISRLALINKALAALNKKIREHLVTRHAAKQALRDAMEHKKAELERAWKYLAEHNAEITKQSADLTTLYNQTSEDTTLATRNFYIFIFWFFIFVGLLIVWVWISVMPVAGTKTILQEPSNDPELTIG
jgi:hypothetical protein